MASKPTSPPLSSCPVCKTSLPFSSRYPDRLCWTCADKARDAHGRLLTFHTSSNSAFEARFKSNNSFASDVTNSHTVYVGALKVWADEAHMGGTVLTPYRERQHLTPPFATCPVCHASQAVNARYPGMLCGECCGNAVDKVGRELSFHNVAKGGGFEARFKADGKLAREVTESHTVYVGALKVWAAEAHMGGYVLTPYRGK